MGPVLLIDGEKIGSGTAQARRKHVQQNQGLGLRKLEASEHVFRRYNFSALAVALSS